MRFICSNLKSHSVFCALRTKTQIEIYNTGLTSDTRSSAKFLDRIFAGHYSVKVHTRGRSISNILQTALKSNWTHAPHPKDFSSDSAQWT